MVADDVVHGTIGVVVVSGSREAPGVARVIAGQGMGRAARINGADGDSHLTIHARD